MRLLMVTQKVDQADPILGFFIGWLKAFSQEWERIDVIAQKEGLHALPASVHIHSLQKESGKSRLSQVFRFWHLVWSLRHKYDSVLVHMTPIWVVLGSPLWLLLRKPVYLWYEARGGGWALRVALLLVSHIFSASASGLPFQTLKSVIVGHGIDTDVFKPSDARDSHLAVTVGRITRAKHLPIIVSAFAALPSLFHLRIAGVPITIEDQRELQSVRGLASSIGVSDRVEIAACPPFEVQTLLSRTTLFLHASETALDKALLEAMASGCLVVSCASAAADQLPPECRSSKEAMGETAKRLLALDPAARERIRSALRQKVLDQHSLPRLAKRLYGEIAGKARAGM